MSETQLLETYRDLSDALLRALEQLSSPESANGSAEEVEEAIRRALADRTFEDLYLRIVRESHENIRWCFYPDLRELARRFFDGWLRLLHGLRSRIRAVEARGGSVPSAEGLASAIARTEERQHGLLDHWNIFTKEDEEDAMEAAKRGELLELDDAFAVIAGVSRERFLQMVEEHKARRRES